MKIVIYCDTLRHVKRFAREFEREQYDLHYFVARRSRESIMRFVARQATHAAYAILINRNVDLFRLWITARLMICTQPLNSARAVARIERLAPDIGLHSTEVIYQDAVIAASGMGILNAHIGMLPEFRGRSVFEWSLFFGRPTGVTVFFINAGIDTGARIIGFYPVAPAAGATLGEAKSQMFALAPAMYRRAIEHIRDMRSLQENDIAKGKRYYVMSQLLLDVLEGALRRPRA